MPNGTIRSGAEDANASTGSKAPAQEGNARPPAKKQRQSPRNAQREASQNARKNTSRKPSPHNKSTGRRGEEAAARFLLGKGYDIVERNWSCFAGEVDIVARDEENLVFVEVKTRTSIEKGFPSEAVTKEKRARYEKIALAYLADHDVVGLTVRFDVIALVAVAPDRAMIRHHINAFGVQ